jgi:hypothetical protein
MRNTARDCFADHAARRTRQLHFQRPHAQRFDTVAREQHQHERERVRKPAGVARRVFLQRLVPGNAAVIGGDMAAKQHDPPVGGQAEQQQQDVRRPCADAARPVGDVVDLRGVRPAWIAPAVADERHEQEHAECHLQDPADFGEKARHAVRQCLRARGIGSFLPLILLLM